MSQQLQLLVTLNVPDDDTPAYTPKEMLTKAFVNLDAGAECDITVEDVQVVPGLGRGEPLRSESEAVRRERKKLEREGTITERD